MLEIRPQYRKQQRSQHQDHTYANQQVRVLSFLNMQTPSVSLSVSSSKLSSCFGVGMVLVPYFLMTDRATNLAFTFTFTS
jgi:hypothetical protein